MLHLVYIRVGSNPSTFNLVQQCKFSVKFCFQLSQNSWGPLLFQPFNLNLIVYVFGYFSIVLCHGPKILKPHNLWYCGIRWSLTYWYCGYFSYCYIIYILFYTPSYFCLFESYMFLCFISPISNLNSHSSSHTLVDISYTTLNNLNIESLNSFFSRTFHTMSMRTLSYAITCTPNQKKIKSKSYWSIWYCSITRHDR